MPEVSVAALLDAAVEAIGGEARPGQTRMAQAVGAALDGGRHLLVQAGTGTGKSLAYLVPALVHAVRREERVVVATATLVLQRQIMEHDLPLARRAVGAALDREPKTALLKGRRNYVCRLKLDGAYGEDEDEALMGRAEAYRGTGSSFAAELGRLTAWARETETGDRDDVPGGVSGRAWNHVSVSAAQCLGAKCPLVGTCFAERAKALAMTADLVVTNHAMLAIQARLGAAADPESDAARAASVLPDHAALVIDEAHQLTESVTSALTGVLTPALVRHAAAQARRTAGKAAPLAEAGASLDRGADALEAAIDAAAPPGGVVRLDRGLPEAVGVAVTEVRAAARAAFSAVGGLKDADAAPKKAARAAFEELVELSDRLGQSGEGDGGGATQGWDGGDGIGREDVVWLSRNALGDGALSAAPLDVARDIGAGLMDQACAVMTSATLALGGQMEPAARAAGLAPGEWDGLDVGSPFDYGRQGIMYIAADLPAPGRGTDHRAAQQERLRELIEASGGGALGLFTSLDAAKEAAAALRGGFDFPILLQGDRSMPSLLEEFLEDEDACLFGTNTLWQGVDAPGRTCRLVAIDRLAFPRPDDPVKSARAAAADKAGQSGFMTVSAAHAALMLAQGAGRLIRTAADKGVVAILDPRLATKRYGAYLIRSMPPMWRTQSLDQVLGALGRL